MSNNKRQSTNTSFYARNRYKILGLLLGFTVVFTTALISFNLFYITNSAFAGVGGDTILTLIRIAFIVVGTPISIILFFIGHRVDDSNNNASFRYPVWIEIIGMGIGLVLGWSISIVWAIMLFLSQGLVWANPLLYVPFPVITPVITYLCFKGAQFVFSFVDKKFRKNSFKPALILFLCSVPFLIYSGYITFQLFHQASSQNSVTITNFKEISQGNGYIFTADMYAPQEGLYNITATIGSSQAITAGTLRLNGIENIDRLNNYELTKGINKLIYYPDNGDCPFGNTSTVQSYVTFKIKKVIQDRITLTQPNSIKQTITCHVL
ncbi:MAG TPA: hypothetical protein VLF93_03360 [Candidatus Saccharimonadales bacterium]|nr:hypothetical protein [Candidatus Saccharimonadales bacterium]